MRKLATIRTISAINPIKGKDRVEMATVDGWTCMVSKKDNFKVGDMCIFCEPDCVFPAKPEWEFLSKYNYRIKTQKFRDGEGLPIYSQGLVLPISILKAVPKLHIGDDVTAELGITQYEPTMDKGEINVVPTKKYPKWLMRYKWFRKLVSPKQGDTSFPSFIAKTDEERLQNCTQVLDYDCLWSGTEKVDGQSCTFALQRRKRFLGIFGKKYEFYVCSRNHRIPIKNNTTYWFCAEKYHIKNVLIDALEENKNLEWIALQGECVAPSVQKNKYKVTEPDLYLFNFIDSLNGRHSTQVLLKFANRYNLKCVPVVFDTIDLKGRTVEEMLQMSNGKSAILPSTLREGIVFRDLLGRKSFKVVSPEFLIKWSE